jgi:hypothetical protein
MERLCALRGLHRNEVVRLGLDAIASLERERPALFELLLEHCRQDRLRRDRRYQNPGRPPAAAGAR